MSPDEYLVRFKGGPLGGETRLMHKSEFTGRRVAVPAIHPFRAFDEGGTFPMKYATLVEYYDLERSLGWNEYEARWVHLQETLIRENETLKKRLRELERAELLLDSLRELKELL